MTVHLAALHRQHALAGAFVPHDQLEAGLEQLVHHVGIDGHRGARAGRAERDFVAQRIGEGHGLAGVPDHGDTGRLRHAADPVELRRLVAHLRIVELGLQRDALRHRGDDAAVARRHRVEMVGGEHAAGARHVDGDHARRAWNVPADVLRDRAGIDVVRAAGRIADDHADGLAGVERCDVLRRGRGAARGENGDCNRCDSFQGVPHTLARAPASLRLIKASCRATWRRCGQRPPSTPGQVPQLKASIFHELSGIKCILIYLKSVDFRKCGLPTVSGHPGTLARRPALRACRNTAEGGRP